MKFGGPASERTFSYKDCEYNYVTVLMQCPSEVCATCLGEGKYK